MANFVYETHSMKNPLLPFIYHRQIAVTQKHTLLNWHENIELLQCIGGKGYIQCGANTFEFSKGDIFLVNANTPHCIYSDGAVVYRCLIIDNSFCDSNGIPISNLYFRNTIRDEGMYAQFEELSAAFDRSTDGIDLAVADIRYFVLGLLRTLCANYVTDRPADMDSAANEHVKHAITYIRKHLSHALTLDDIAGFTGVSKYHLAREFKAFTGKTIIQTVNLIRCAEAKRLIESGLSVSAAAAECGFENLSYFSRTFKKLFRKLPSSFLSDSADAALIARSQLDEANCY